jgi:hypothetical protein
METVIGRLALDEHVAMVVEFMERNLPVDRLEYVASRIPALARVLWSIDRCAFVEKSLLSHETQLSASECAPVGLCAGDDSVVEAGVGARK